MSIEQAAVLEKQSPEKTSIVNDFSMMVATVNGSGSATANLTLLRALFRMGIPVSGKNIFPSNIQGMPTWYTIRANKDGFVARKEKNSIVVAMNAVTFKEDILSLIPGGVLYYADDIKLEIPRNDIIVYPMPVNQLAKETNVPPRMQTYIRNMVYVGILAQMLGIDLEKIRLALAYHFEDKEVAIESNYSVITSAVEWAEKNLQKVDPFVVETMHATDDLYLGDGNTAAALGAIYGGIQFEAWYPITPATNLAEQLDAYLPILRKDPETGKSTFAVVQAEDEISAVGMAIGAGWGGLRAMTSTSGPGLSLMTEYLGLAYSAEIPVVVWDVQRMGPSTGLPTHTSQGDLSFVNFLGHGDTHFVILFPGNLEECFEFGWRAFDLAEHLQTPVIVLSDLDLGMNHWMTRAFDYPDQPIDRGKILWEEGLEELLQQRDGDWGRYLDIDGDGIPYRTVIGNRHPHASYFTRGTGHDEYARYNEEPEVWERISQRLMKKFETAKELVPGPVIEWVENPSFSIISFGSTEGAVKEAKHIFAEKGIMVDTMRIRSKPFTLEVREFIQQHERNYVVEANDDGQLRQLLILDMPECVSHLKQASKNDGVPIAAMTIVNMILEQEKA
jgi:2-oxoglutarate ferredoxin oxidoreductase subunit alpha